MRPNAKHHGGSTERDTEDLIHNDYLIARTALLDELEHLDDQVPEAERLRAAIASYFLRGVGWGNFPLWLLRQSATDPRIQSIARRYVEAYRLRPTTQLLSLLTANRFAVRENALLHLISTLASYDESPRSDPDPEAPEQQA